MKPYTTEENIAITLQRLQDIVERNGDEDNYSYQTLNSAAIRFCEWEEKNMDKDENGWPAWTDIAEGLDFAYYINGEGKEIDFTDWDEALEAYLYHAVFPIIVKHQPQK